MAAGLTSNRISGTLVPPAVPRGIASGAAGLIAFGALMNPGRLEGGPVLCLFRRATGVPCPGCGLTRSIAYFLHGQWHLGFRTHAFGLLAVIVAAFLALHLVDPQFGVRFRRKLGALFRPSSMFSAGIVALSLGWWAVVRALTWSG